MSGIALLSDNRHRLQGNIDNSRPLGRSSLIRVRVVKERAKTPSQVSVDDGSKKFVKDFVFDVSRPRWSEDKGSLIMKVWETDN